MQLFTATIADLSAALDAGTVTAVDLLALTLARVDAYDTNGPRLNSLVEEAPDAIEAARASDARRAAGRARGPLDGIPYTVKDSYAVAGMGLSAGSPAFEHLVAREDAFTVARLRAAGAVLVGRTTMPPMAAGGTQDGVHGRAESPYNADYLPAAWYSGSSSGSGSATAAGLGVFGMAEETVSSGRSPASNNGLVAYTPSRGILSIRGNWPLFPIRDVVVPHTRCLRDLFTVLDAIVVDDPDTRSDFWRSQTAVPLPRPSEVRPESYHALADPDALRGKRLGVPAMYIGADPRIEVRPSVLALWERAVADLEACGAEVVVLDRFPVMDTDDGGDGIAQNRAGITEPSPDRDLEYLHVNAHAAQHFLDWVADPLYPSWEHIDPATIFPNPPGGAPEELGIVYAAPLQDYGRLLAEYGGAVRDWSAIPGLDDLLRRLERRRADTFESWMADHGLDAVVFPANADLGESCMDHDVDAFVRGNRNGTYFSHMNRIVRELGIPTVSVCMGILEDIGMPVDLTFAGPAYSDSALLTSAFAYEHATGHRRAPGRTPALPGEEAALSRGAARRPARGASAGVDKACEGATEHPAAGARAVDGNAPAPLVRAAVGMVRGAIVVTGRTQSGDPDVRTAVRVNGRPVELTGLAADGGSGSWRVELDPAPYLADGEVAPDERGPGAEPLSADEIVVLALARDTSGRTDLARTRLALRPRRARGRAVR